MTDTSVKKVDARFAPTGDMGQKYLASGQTVSMRLWGNEQPLKPPAHLLKFTDATNNLTNNLMDE